MAYTTIDNPELYFQTKLYTGNGGTNALTLDGSENMQPDWVWIKNRNGTQDHHLFDSVRGTLKRLESNSSTNEETRASSLTSYDSDGFTLGTYANTNTNNDTYVAWNWKAGTSFTNDASSTGIGTIDSTGSASDTAGFSIVSFAGTGSNGTIKHGLSSTPKFVTIKNRTTAGWSWKTYVNPIAASKRLHLNTTDAATTDTAAFNSTAPTSSVFSVGTSVGTNGSSNNYIAYCFADVKGYSKFGSYSGNSSTDGTFCFTGFKPSFVIVKQVSADNRWVMSDNKRDPDNPVNGELNPNDSVAEDTSSTPFDFLSNGFKLRRTGDVFNTSGQSYIYMAFAENPFVTSTGVPATAR